jgi:hypothetical protein
MQTNIPPHNNTPAAPTKRLPKTTSTLSNKEGGADHKKDSEKARSYTSECVETTSSRSLERRNSRCTDAQFRYTVSEYVKLTPHSQLDEACAFSKMVSRMTRRHFHVLEVTCTSVRTHESQPNNPTKTPFVGSSSSCE